VSIDGFWHANDCSEQLSYICKATKVRVRKNGISKTQLSIFFRNRIFTTLAKFIKREPDIRGNYLDCDEDNGWHPSSEILNEDHGHHCIKAFDMVKTFDAAADVCSSSEVL